MVLFEKFASWFVALLFISLCSCGFAHLEAKETLRINLVKGRTLNARFDLRFKLEKPKTATARLLLHWEDAANHAAISFEDGFIRVLEKTDGEQRVLLKVGSNSLAQTFTLRQRLDELVLFQGRDEIFRHPLPANVPKLWSSGRMGIAVGPNAKFSNFKYQACSTIRERDGFMRSAKDADPWKHYVGKFSIARSSNPGISSSPFWYVVKPEHEKQAEVSALSSFGNYFWDTYEAHASMRLAPKPTHRTTVSSLMDCMGTEHSFLPGGHLAGYWGCSAAADVVGQYAELPDSFAMGLTFYATSPDTYWVLRMASSGRRRMLELVEVIQGQEKILASKETMIPFENWFRLRALVKGSNVRCYLDDSLAFKMSVKGLVSGGIGLYVRGQCGSKLDPLFDDVGVTSIDDISNDAMEADQDGPSICRLLRIPDLTATWVPEYFKSQPTMLKWANPRSTFAPIGPFTWYVGDVFCDGMLRWESESAPFKKGIWEAVIGSDKIVQFELKKYNDALSAQAALDKANAERIEKEKNEKNGAPQNVNMKQKQKQKQKRKRKRKRKGHAKLPPEPAVVPAPDPKCGLRVCLVPEADEIKIEVKQGEDVLEKKVIPFDATLGAHSIELVWRRGQLLVRMNEKEVARFLNANWFQKNGRTGISINGKSANPGDLNFRSTHLRDEIFSEAPVQWRAAAGQWAMTSRWACSPHYTWFGGKGVGSGHAILWSKWSIGGDLDIDAFVSQSMFARKAPHYDLPVNFGLSFCADGKNLGSGYAFHFGLYDRDSVLYRKDQVVANSTVYTKPDKDATGIKLSIHRHWFHLKIKRRGATIKVYVDGHEMCSFTDPDPIKDGQLAVFSEGPNGVMVSRIRAAFEEGGASKSPFKEIEGIAKNGTQVGEIAKANISGATRKSIPFSKWEALGKDPSGLAVRLTKVREGDRTLTDAVRVQNLRTGGHVAIAAEGLAVNSKKTPYLAFRYRLGVGARINCYVKHKDRLWRIALNAGRSNTTHSLPLVDVSEVIADGKWHSVVVPIHSALARELSDQQPQIASGFPIDALVFGNYEVDQSLRIGFGGNHQGCTYAISAPTFLASQEVGEVFEVAFEPGSSRKYAAQVFQNESPVNMPSELFKDVFTFKPESNGLYWVQVGMDHLNEYRGYPILVGPLIPEEKSPRLIAKGVEPVLLKEEKPLLVDLSFESGVGSIRSYAGAEGGYLYRELQSGVRGEQHDRALRVSAIEPGGMLGVYIRKKSFDVRAYGLLEFDIRIERGTKVNVLLRTRKGPFEIFINDTSPGSPHWDADPPIPSDGKWHHVSLDLLSLLKKNTDPELPTDYMIRDLAIGDGGYSIISTNGCYRVDNIRLYRNRNVQKDVTFEWSGSKPSSYRATLTKSPDASFAKTETIAVNSHTFPVSSAGTYYLHVRDENSKQVLSRKVILNVDLDQEPPTVSDPEPKPMKKACPKYLYVRLEDDGSGINFHETYFIVNGRKYALGTGHLRYESSACRFRLRLEGVQGQPLFKEGENVHVKLVAQDFAGNALKKPLEWTFVFDSKMVAEAPLAPEIVYHPSECYLFDPYDEGIGDDRNWLNTEPIHLVKNGNGYLRVSRRQTARVSDLTFVSTPFDAGRYPMVRFKMKLGDIKKISLNVFRGNSNLPLPITSLQSDYGLHHDVDVKRGRLPELAQRQWQTITMDIRARFPEVKNWKKVESFPVSFLNFQSKLKKPSQYYEVDNVTIYSPKGRTPAFSWLPPADPSGIEGYSTLFDQKPDSVPAGEISTKKLRAEFKDVEPGTWYFHLRAKNGGEKWSDTRHCKIVIED